MAMALLARVSSLLTLHPAKARSIKYFAFDVSNFTGAPDGVRVNILGTFLFRNVSWREGFGARRLNNL